MTMADRPSFVATGDINPCRFIKLDATATAAGVIATAANTDTIIGISAQGTKQVPIDGASTLAASAGLEVEVHLAGDMCMLLIGTGGCTVGDKLMYVSDGATTATSGKQCGAIALSTGLATEKIFVLVLPPGIVA